MKKLFNGQFSINWIALGGCNFSSVDAGLNEKWKFH